MKFEGVKDVEFITPCHLIDQSERENWDFKPGEQTKFLEQHRPHVGAKVLYKDGSNEFVDMGDPSMPDRVAGTINSWKLKIHAVHVVVGAVPIYGIVGAGGRILEGAHNDNLLMVAEGLSMLVPAAVWEVFTVWDWRTRLQGPKITAQKYSQALNDSGSLIRTKLGLAA